jgi:hypothetical protein
MVWTRAAAGLAAACIALYTLSARAADPPTYSVDLGDENFGKLKQTDVNGCKDDAGGLVACGPTAAANSFFFLQKTNPELYGTGLVGQGTYDDLKAVANTLATPLYMDCALCNGGTDIYKFIDGKKAFIEAHAPGRTTYKNRTVFADDTYADPTWQFLFNELMDEEDVELLLSYHDGTDYKNDQDKFYGGHFVTVTGMNWTDADMDSIIDAAENAMFSFIDPGTGTERTFSLFHSTFGLDTNYGANGTIIGASISAIVSESPIPEPETIALLVVGLLGLARLKARRPV